MKTKAQKKETIDSVAAALPGATITIFTTFARAGEPGLTVAQMQALRRVLRESGGEYVVAKKTLVDKAIHTLSYDGVDVFAMDGSLGVVFGHGDNYALAKSLWQFAKANPALKMFSAWMDGHALDSVQVLEMATMPTRDELLVRLLGMMKYPLSSLVIVLNQIASAKTN